MMTVGAPVFRSEYMFWEQQGGYIERRQLFLRSYHFSRKKSPRERVRHSLVRVRRLVWVRLRAARRLPRLLWARLRSACWPSSAGRRCSFQRLAGLQPRRFSASFSTGGGGGGDWSS